MIKNDKLNWATKFSSNFTDEDNFLETILKSYGVEDIQRFLNPSEEDINNPFLMKNMKKGVELFHEVIQKDEPKICLKIDCD